MDINQIDWNDIWREGAIFIGGQADKVTSWNNNAARWNESQIKSDYGQRVLKRLELHSDWTALDVGAGTGVLAVPMAKMCKHVTALDGSSEMLQYLKQNAEREGVSNITCVNKAPLCRKKASISKCQEYGTGDFEDRQYRLVV